MNSTTQVNDYRDLIKKIKRKRASVIVLTIIAMVALMLFASPTKLEFLGETVLDYKGLPLAVTLLLVLLCLFLGTIAYAFASLPLTASMDLECDPQKYLILNSQLNKQKNINHVYAAGYLYMGDYRSALEYAQRMVASPKGAIKLVGLFQKSRCEFLLGNGQALRQTAAEYAGVLSADQKLKGKGLVAYQKIYNEILFMCAIADEDLEKIKELRSYDMIWNQSKAAEGFVNYLKGVAAYLAGEKEEAVYRLKAVKENCSKTVFASLAEKHLALLR